MSDHLVAWIAKNQFTKRISCDDPEPLLCTVYCDMSSGDYIQMNASGETVVIGDWYVEKRERVRTREKW